MIKTNRTFILVSMRVPHEEEGDFSDMDSYPELLLD